MDLDWELEPKLISLISQLISLEDSAYANLKLIVQIISLLNSVDLDLQPKPESELMSLVTQTIFVFNSMDLDSHPEPLSELISLISQKVSETEFDLISLISQTLNLKPMPKLMSHIQQICYLVRPTDSEFMSPVAETCHLKPESKLVSLISEFMSLEVNVTADSYSDSEWDSKAMSLIIQMISLVSSTDWDSQPKPDPESELMSLITQTIFLFKSMDLDSQPKPMFQLISFISQEYSRVDSAYSDSDFMLLVHQALRLKPEPKLISLIHQIFSIVISMHSKSGKLISLRPQVEVELLEGKIRTRDARWRSNDKWLCLPVNWEKFKFTEEGVTHFLCLECNGENHEEYEKAPVEIKHPLHPKHPLQLVLLCDGEETRKCYCCDEDLKEILYYCSACDFAINFSCAEKPPLLSIDHPKWHEHTLALFSRTTSLTCDVCALEDSSCAFYICPPCGFVVHRRCIDLPRVIRISRHLHRVYFTLSFGQGDRSCGVCRRKVDDDYGGYSCKKNGCSFAAHSKCALQSNIWDGEELEEVPEVFEEEVEPFVTIGDGVIQHFSHPHHHLKLDENTDRDYDENKQCQACVTPVYFGNFYYCMQCDFVLHETCANLSRNIHHPIHPHELTLVKGNNHVMNDESRCSACPWFCTAGILIYECGKEGCRFKLHVQCATISEPLIHGSHMHPLFLTCKPGEQRRCMVCKYLCSYYKETFNCIECEFALCFKCATKPQKVMYKHDKHMLTLSYGKETSTMTFWCEACERKIKPNGRFYLCDEYNCVTLHIECVIGDDLYMKPGSSWFLDGEKVEVLANNQLMSRPICSYCEDRCPYKTVFQISGSIFCSTSCMRHVFYIREVTK